MASIVSSPSLLLALPDPCLLAVLQCLAADDQRSLFSTARSHSRLHQAALAAVQELRKLHTLHLAVDATTAADRLHGVCQLTGLRGLGVVTPMNAPDELLLQLTQLRQLTSLTYNGASFGGDRDTIRLAAKVPGDEPVWRQVLRLHLDHSDPAVAQQATAALAE